MSEIVEMSEYTQDAKHRDVGVMLDLAKQKCEKLGIKKVYVLMLEEGVGGAEDHLHVSYAGVDAKDTIYIHHMHEKDYL